MSNKWIGAIASVVLLVPLAARADVINGSFTGTITPSGFDQTGVFGPANTDLTNDTITGTFSYNTALLSQAISGGVNTATGTGLGAVTVTITIGGHSYTFNDQSGSSVVIDDGSVSGESEFNLSNSDFVGGHSDTFTLQLSDPFTPFVSGGTSLTQSLSIGNPFFQTNSFSIDDAGPVGAGGAFSISSLTSSDISSMPEPAGMAVVAMGLIGLAGVRARKARRD
ncbi:MAG TPA: hypothetical protein VMU81_08655 [Acetobacteraceae bacterium]|nr:hypothetical protein [Acetobacteraceae bacterium]